MGNEGTNREWKQICTSYIYFPAAQEEALSLWQWRALEKGQEGAQKRLEEPSSLEGRKVGGNAPPHFEFTMVFCSRPCFW